MPRANILGRWCLGVQLFGETRARQRAGSGKPREHRGSGQRTAEEGFGGSLCRVSSKARTVKQRCNRLLLAGSRSWPTEPFGAFASV